MESGPADEERAPLRGRAEIRWPSRPPTDGARRAAASLTPDPFYESRFLLAWAVQQSLDLPSSGRGGRRPGRPPAAVRAVAHSCVTNYRMVLELTAQKIASKACPHARPDRVSFPVAFDLVNFRSMMTTRFPGLRKNHGELWAYFLRLQPFLPASSGWLEALQGLWNGSIPIDGGGAADGAAPPHDALTFRFRGDRWGLREFLLEVGEEEARLLDGFAERLGRL